MIEATLSADPSFHPFQAEFFDRVYDLPFQDWLELKNGASAADPGEVS